MSVTLPHTPRMEATAKRASEVAAGMGLDHLGTEHMLLAMLDDHDGIAGGVLHRLGFAEAVRTELERIMTHPGYTRVSTDTWNPPA